MSREPGTRPQEHSPRSLSHLFLALSKFVSARIASRLRLVSPCGSRSVNSSEHAATDSAFARGLANGKLSRRPRQAEGEAAAVFVPTCPANRDSQGGQLNSQLGSRLQISPPPLYCQARSFARPERGASKNSRVINTRAFTCAEYSQAGSPRAHSALSSPLGTMSKRNSPSSRPRSGESPRRRDSNPVEPRGITFNSAITPGIVRTSGVVVRTTDFSSPCHDSFKK